MKDGMGDMHILGFAAYSAATYSAGYKAGELAERQRCADVAEKYRKKNEPRNGFGSQPAYSTAWNIKAEILKPKTKRKPKAETSREETPLSEAGSGADASKVVCPALIDDVGSV